jgi:MarR family transcriptional regulator, organic hydroperoxide resistance regulator
MTPRPRSRLQREMTQPRPFRSARQEATVALLRTASVVNRVMSRVLEPFDLSLAQYNALRIIKGAGHVGIPTLAVRDRMIEEGTTITRLLDKLEEAGLIERRRSLPDRRQVMCFPTLEGLQLLKDIDPAIDMADEDVVATLEDGEVEQLIALLDRVRAASAARGAARTGGRAE